MLDIPASEIDTVSRKLIFHKQSEIFERLDKAVNKRSIDAFKKRVILPSGSIVGSL